MKQPYENVYLGNFIFALGFQAAKTRKGLGDKAVQLVQQTPDENKLNDLFVNWSGKSFIFEFKRNKAKISTELEKEAKRLLNDALNSPENERELYLSKKSHFLGFGLKDNLHFTYYSAIHEEINNIAPLDKFCSLILDDKKDVGINYEELVEYLAFIGNVTKSSSDGCGGFVLNMADDGSVNMVPFETVDILSKSLDIRPEPPEPPRPTPSFGMSM